LLKQQFCLFVALLTPRGLAWVAEVRPGLQVTVKGSGGEPDAVVTIKGLTGEGYLLAEDVAGERVSLSPDGNSLNFFDGLVMRKLPPSEPADLYVC